jgi:formylglycine-generating enzyme required for sulfatase activity
MEYQDFNLKIAHLADDRYKVSVQSQFGKADAEIGRLLSEEEMRAFVLGVGQPRHASRNLQAVEQLHTVSPQDLGTRLYETIFRGVIADCLRGSLRIAREQNAGLRIRLDVADAPGLVNVPWEFMYDPVGARFLSLSVETPIVRRLPTEDWVEAREAVLPLRVLVMISGPQDYPRLDVDQEWAKLRESVADLEQRGLLQLERMQSATLRELQRLVRQQDYHIFHFIGHGGFDEQAEDAVLILESEAHKGRPTSATYLGTLLRDEKTIQLVVLNACEGGRTSLIDPFAGAAQGLLRQGVPAVVAMQFEITDRAAIIFSHEFYAAIADGYPVDSAVVEARKAIYADQNVSEWGTPVLYQNVPDGRIFELEAPKSSAEASSKRMVSPTTENASQATATAEGSLVKRIFANQDSLGYRIARWSAVLAMLGFSLSVDSDAFMALLLGFVYLSVAWTTRSQKLANVVWLMGLIGLLVLSSQVDRFGMSGAVQMVAFASLLMLVLISIMLASLRPASPGYRLALAGAGLGIASTVLLLVVDGPLTSPFVQAAEPGAIIFFGVLIIWRAMDNVSRNWAMTWRDTLLVVGVGSIVLIWTIIGAVLNRQVVLGHLANIVASLLIVRGGIRNTSDSEAPDLGLGQHQVEKRPSPVGVTSQATGDSAREAVQESGAAYSGTEVFAIDQPIHLELVPVPAGKFTMGSDPSRDKHTQPDEQPAHHLYLPRFYVGKYPVTNQQYAAFVEATGYHVPEHWAGGKIPSRVELHPVTGVSRQGALAFCQWLSRETGFDFRLPTEAEWEKAARSSDGRLYPWGDEPPTPDLCNFEDTSIEGTTPVDQFVKGASPYGVLDMSGNTQEWTSSIYQIDGSPSFDYPYNPSDGREALRTEGDFDLVQRGGAFDSAAQDVRCAKRSAESRGFFESVGIRVAVIL